MLKASVGLSGIVANLVEEMRRLATAGGADTIVRPRLGTRT